MITSRIHAQLCAALEDRVLELAGRCVRGEIGFDQANRESMELLCEQGSKLPDELFRLLGQYRTGVIETLGLVARGRQLTAHGWATR